MKCSQCGKQDYSTNYMKGWITSFMAKYKVCFTCAFWLAHMDKWENDPLWCRIDGRSYYTSKVLEPRERAVSESAGGRFKGHGGREFCIQFNDGRLLRTDDLWTQGDIPAWAKERMPDNAKFITRDAYWRLDREAKRENE